MSKTWKKDADTNTYTTPKKPTIGNALVVHVAPWVRRLVFLLRQRLMNLTKLLIDTGASFTLISKRVRDIVAQEKRRMCRMI